MKSNVSSAILNLLSKEHHKNPQHPIGIISAKIIQIISPDKVYDQKLPFVHVSDNFDKLRIPKDHPSRGATDTYYLTEDWVLRTHMTAHLAELARDNSFYVDCGAVARKDTVDATHYPVFTQMDCFRETETPEDDLKRDLSKIIEGLFPGREYRFQEDYFPFTINSIEAEVKFGDRWVEVLGGGTVHPEIMQSLGKGDRKAYAYGLGIDRLAMILFEIPDIRLLWSEDKRFISQFRKGEITKFIPFSDYPPCNKDIAFWIDNKEVSDGSWSRFNDFCDFVRERAGNLVEEISLIDEFDSPKKGLSNCYRIVYRSLDRSLTHEQINAIQESVRKEVESNFSVTLR